MPGKAAKVVISVRQQEILAESNRRTLDVSRGSPRPSAEPPSVPPKVIRHGLGVSTDPRWVGMLENQASHGARAAFGR